MLTVSSQAAQESNEDLAARVLRLEKAVEQLQKKVFPAESVRTTSAPAAVGVTCSLKTPFDGIFSATDAKEDSARATALEKCNQKTKRSIYCVEKDLQCTLKK